MRPAAGVPPAGKGPAFDGEVAVVGLARSGRAAARVLATRDVAVYASDGGSGAALEAVAKELAALGASVEVGRHDLARIARASLVVASPGVPPTAPPIRAALDAGIPVVGEVEIALRLLPALRYIAITGTNGKTTTTALAGAMLEALGCDAATVGNIGMPVIELALEADPREWAAIELSSFQLHDTPSVAPVVGVLTNLSPNHLDRYDSVEAYYGDKQRLFRNATLASTWVANQDDPAVRAMLDGVAGGQHWFSLDGEADAWYDRSNDQLVVLGDPLIARADLPMLGDHNVANALTAALAVMLADERHRTAPARERIAGVLRTAAPLAHRNEPVAETGGVAWINDSKSTNIASTLVALRGMTRPTVLLLGGRHKGEPYTDLVPELQRTVRHVVAYGEAAGLIAGDLEGAVPVEVMRGGFDAAVERARTLASPGDAVLLSPACSSYDMFANYEERGAAFRQLARRVTAVER
ncbi:MAG: UDP-N-acetylmuramoyl-L-alanine--D-glutamate ligase [Gemmatimonadaceae bacterium]|nr:UDP-N-acetylmuramoyl-L-alanine--D-glutamate ligase [Gemmatimonadaceae bacterium]